MTREQLAKWFDLSKRIEKWEEDTAVEQMALYAIKGGDDPHSEESKKCYEDMRKAIRDHNEEIDRRKMEGFEKYKKRMDKATEGMSDKEKEEYIFQSFDT